MAFFAVITLTWRGTVLDRVWAFNPAGYKRLAPFGGKAGILFGALGTLVGVAPGDCDMATQVVENVVNFLLGRILEGAVGIIASSALLFYLFRRRVRAAFTKPGQVFDNQIPGGPQP